MIITIIRLPASCVTQENSELFHTSVKSRLIKLSRQRVKIRYYLPRLFGSQDFTEIFHNKMLAPDTVLQNRYRIIRQLGQGGMGTVYEARALRLNTTVALKETHFIEENLRKQFEREAQLLAGLCHPALPRVIDHFDEGEGLYLVMDFIKGEDLWRILKKRGNAFPVREVLAWAEQLLDALHYLHTQKPPVIHRDIKLQNLKITDEGKIILLDFGLAKGLVDPTAVLSTTRTVLGFSLPYAPLEQILQIDESWREHLSVVNPQEVERLRKIRTDHRSDLYSVGATLLHLLTGKIPTNAPTRAISIWSGRIDPLETALTQAVPNSLWPLFKRAMALGPNRRFSSAAEMRQALNASYNQSSPSSYEATQSVKFSHQPIRPNRLKWLARSSVVVLIVGVITSLFYVITQVANKSFNLPAQLNASPALPPTASATIEPTASPIAQSLPSPVTTPNTTNKIAITATPTPEINQRERQARATANYNNARGREMGNTVNYNGSYNVRRRGQSRGSSNDDIAEMSRRISQLEQERAALMVNYTSDWPAVKKIDLELRSLKRRLALLQLQQ